MLDVALKLLKEITSNSYNAYLVGGFVRDYIIGIDSNDIDITTNATPKQIKEMFEDSCLPTEEYGAVTVVKNGIKFEITTFRKEIDYVDNRKPTEVKYIDDLYPDLLRRDFIINTICMDENGHILDILDGRKDIENKIIRTVGNAKEKFEEDILRVLRAIRFATILDFSLDDEIIEAIHETKHLLSNLSYYRKKSELDKIFASANAKKGIKLLLELGLDKELEIPKLRKICDIKSDSISLIGVWSVLDVLDKYPFNKNEQELISDINTVLNLNNLDPMTLYSYGLYVNSVAGEIKDLDIKAIAESYSALVIKEREDIEITSDDIMNLLHKEPGKYLTDIYSDIEREILYRRLNNNKNDICNYIEEKYGI